VFFLGLPLQRRGPKYNLFCFAARFSHGRVNNFGSKTIQDGTNGLLVTSANTQIAQSGLEVVVEVGEDHQGDGHSGVDGLHVGISLVRREVLVASQSATEEGDQISSESVEGGGVGGVVDGTWGLLAVEEGENGGIFEFLGYDGSDGGDHELNFGNSQSGSILSANGSGIHNLVGKAIKEDSNNGKIAGGNSQRLKGANEYRVESIENISVNGHIHVHLHHVGVASVRREVGVGTSQSSTKIGDEISSEPVELVRVVQKVNGTRR